jgi:hypothetical protein
MFKCLKIAKNSSSKLLIHLDPQINFFNNGNMNIQQNIVWVVDLACERGDLQILLPNFKCVICQNVCDNFKSTMIDWLLKAFLGFIFVI